MSFWNVKNLSLKTVPTSKLLFYAIYREQSRFSKEDIDTEIDRRIYKKGFDSIVERDFDIIQSRGSNLDDYTFDFSRGLVGTTESIYSHIKPYHEDIYEQLNEFTFSELALAGLHFSSLFSLYKLRDKVVKQELKEGMSRIHSKAKISDFGKDNVARVVALSKLQEENHEMMNYFDSIALCFCNLVFPSLPFGYICELKIFDKLGSPISSSVVEEYKNLNNDVYDRDLSVAESFPKMYMKK